MPEKSYYEAVNEFKRKYWLEQLDEHGWNFTVTAAAAGVNRQHLYVILDKLGIKRTPVC